MSLSKLNPYRGATLGTTAGKTRFQANTAIGAATTIVQDVDISDFDLVTILVSMTAGAATDLAVTIAPILTDGTTFQGALPVTQVASVLVVANAVTAIQVNCTGLQGIEVQVKNNNAAGKSINFIDVLAGVTGTDF